MPFSFSDGSSGERSFGANFPFEYLKIAINWVDLFCWSKSILSNQIESTLTYKIITIRRWRSFEYKIWAFIKSEPPATKLCAKDSLLSSFFWSHLRRLGRQGRCVWNTFASGRLRCLVNALLPLLFFSYVLSRGKRNGTTIITTTTIIIISRRH